ncbi:MAG: glycosyltransferase family 2 protein [Deltaproteobacteria bacterium]|nr:glycosyltransferase family 2 protein [Deltaproteobacteria bacterium]MCL4874404.1 glycosyltransferase family 2 protein [bacterium]
MAPKVSIVVLNWNGYRDTAECVQSLRDVVYPALEIIVVDNGSVDGSLNALKRRFPSGIRFIGTGKNLGFAGGCNAGIRQALENGADYVLLLNNDTVVAPDFVKEIVTAAEGEPRAGILCSKVYFHDRPDVVWYSGAYFNSLLGWGRHLGFNKKDSGGSGAMETGRPTGCAMMVTRELCERTGLFDEDYFCYAEDLDWGMRAKRAGFKVLYVPSSRVWHKVSASSGSVGVAASLYYSTRNTLRCVDLNRPLPLPLRQARYLSILAASFLSLLTMKTPAAPGAKMITKGFRDYLRGIKGELR